MLHDSLAGPIAKRVAAEFGVADAELRVELVASHLAGLAFARYQLKIEPIASTHVEDAGRLAGADRAALSGRAPRAQNLRTLGVSEAFVWSP